MIGRWISLCAWTVLLTACDGALGQPVGSLEVPSDRQVSYFVGYLSSETLMTTRIDGEPVEAKADSGLLLGIRLGADEEYTGWEVTLAGAFSDLDLEADPAADIPSASDADLYMANVNFLWFPTGNEAAQGRVRPFLTAGSGLAVFDSDFSDVDSEAIYNFNAGAGVKFYLGDDGSTLLRFDWRWHYMKDFSNNFDDMYRQELSVGFGKRY